MTQNNSDNDFQKLSDAEGEPSLMAEFFQFLKYNKKWWLAPIILMLFLIAALLLLSATAAAPFIYTLF